MAVLSLARVDPTQADPGDNTELPLATRGSRCNASSTPSGSRYVASRRVTLRRRRADGKLFPIKLQFPLTRIKLRLVRRPRTCAFSPLSPPLLPPPSSRSRDLVE